MAHLSINREAVWFRFVVLVAVVAAVGFGAMFFFEVDAQQKTQSDVDFLWGRLSHHYDKCPSKLPSDACPDIAFWADRWKAGVHELNKHDHRATIALYAAAIVPVAVFLIFFSIRWVSTGRLRPVSSSVD